jgi:hypothetical protein
VARGWESKSIEAQQDAAAERRIGSAGATPRPAGAGTRRATLLLARTRAVADLQTASAAAHRAMLERAIAELDRQLAALPDPE